MLSRHLYRSRLLVLLLRRLLEEQRDLELEIGRKCLFPMFCCFILPCLPLSFLSHASPASTVLTTRFVHVHTHALGNATRKIIRAYSTPAPRVFHAFPPLFFHFSLHFNLVPLQSPRPVCRAWHYFILFYSIIQLSRHSSRISPLGYLPAE